MWPFYLPTLPTVVYSSLLWCKITRRWVEQTDKIDLEAGSFLLLTS